LMSERVHQRDQVAGEGAGVVAVLGLVGQPDPALVDRNPLEGAGQGRNANPPGVPGLGPAMDQQRRSVTADDRVQAQLAGVDIAAGEGVGEPGRGVRRPPERAGALGEGQAGRSCAHEAPLPTDSYRSDRKAARSSSENSCGCSQAAKWPPLSTWW